MQKTNFIRKGKWITKLGHGLIPDQKKDWGSINAAKRESRQLQGKTPGEGLVRVER